jgi:hypothetical protein
VHDPARLPQLLDELSDRIRRIHTRVLVGGLTSVRAATDATGTRSEPWVLAVLLGHGRGLGEDEHRRLARVARSGPACGVQLVLLDVPVVVNAPVEQVRFRADGTATTSMTGPYVTVVPDPPPARDRIIRAGDRIADEHEAWRSRVSTYADLVERAPQLTSEAGLRAPIGFIEDRQVDVVLADASPARPGRRAQRLGQDQPAAHDDHLAGGALLARRGRVLPPGLQGGRVVRAVRPRAARPQLAAARPAGRREHQHRPGVRARAAAVPGRRDAPPRRGRRRPAR